MRKSSTWLLKSGLLLFAFTSTLSAADPYHLIHDLLSKRKGETALDRPDYGFPAILAAQEGTHVTPAPIKPLISLDYLDKLDIRVGTILTVDHLPNSGKLVRLKVDFGDHTRSILVAMKKERLNPKAEIEGKQTLFVVNLEPRKMAGELSEGMIFDIGYADQLVPVLAMPERPVPNGARAG